MILRMMLYDTGEGVPVTPSEKTLEMALNPELYANEVAKKYGINLRGSGQDIVIEFNPQLTFFGKNSCFKS